MEEAGAASGARFLHMASGYLASVPGYCSVVSTVHEVPADPVVCGHISRLPNIARAL